MAGIYLWLVLAAGCSTKSSGPWTRIPAGAQQVTAAELEALRATCTRAGT